VERRWNDRRPAESIRSLPRMAEEDTVVSLGLSMLRQSAKLTCLVLYCSLAKEPGLWQLRDQDPLPTWVKGRAIIIGDAAHAMSVDCYRLPVQTMLTYVQPKAAASRTRRRPIYRRC
jgi:hypothetical protein